VRPADPREQQAKISVTVATVDRGFLLTPFWSMEMAGESPSM
jgi:hypothetical protein